MHLELGLVFGRKKDKSEGGITQAEVDHPEREGAKNRPTPKRRDQEAARKRPLVQDDRKSARAADRQARRAAAQRTREAMVTGDERNMPARDKGPVRRFVRDVVDARFNPGEILLPLMLAVLVLSFLSPAVASYAFLAVYVIIILAVLDAVLLWRRTRAAIWARFGEDTETKGLGMYQGMRSFQMRRTRLPKAMIKRGEQPR